MTERISELLNMLRDESNCNVLDYVDEAADLIESLSAELEYVKRERDALLRELKTKFGCEMCTHQAPKGFDDYISNDCMDCINFCNWQWRGVKEAKT